MRKSNNYFEGWYFKNTSDDFGISFIPGISITKEGKKAFIQVITSNSSYYVGYDIPFKVFHFRGFICSLVFDSREYRFATYNNSKIIKYDIDGDCVNIVLKKGKYTLEIKTESFSFLKLIAPVKGRMDKDIMESIRAFVYVILKENDKVIFSDMSVNCGLEIVNQ